MAKLSFKKQGKAPGAEILRAGKALAHSHRRRPWPGLHVGPWAPAVSRRLLRVALNDTIS